MALSHKYDGLLALHKYFIKYGAQVGIIKDNLGQNLQKALIHIPSSMYIAIPTCLIAKTV